MTSCSLPSWRTTKSSAPRPSITLPFLSVTRTSSNTSATRMRSFRLTSAGAVPAARFTVVTELGVRSAARGRRPVVAGAGSDAGSLRTVAAGSVFSSALIFAVALGAAAASGAGADTGSAAGASSAAGSRVTDGAAAGVDGTTTARTVLPRCRRCFSSRFCSFASRAAFFFAAFLSALLFFSSSTAPVRTAAAAPAVPSDATAKP